MTADGDFRTGAAKSADPIYGRIADTYAHAWAALSGRTGRLKTKRSWLRRIWPLAALAVLAAGFIPVPLTTLAPAEIVADVFELHG